MRRLTITAQYRPRAAQINGQECGSWGTIAEQQRSLAVVLEPAVQHIGVHSMLQGQGCNRGAGLLAGGQQLGLELRGIGAAGARHRVARRLRVFEHRVHGGFVDTILLRGVGRIKMGLPASYVAPTDR